MQSRIISYSLHKKKERVRAPELQLEEKIKSIESVHAASPQEHMLSNPRKLKIELNWTIDKKRLCLENFVHCNKLGKFLPNRIKQTNEKAAMSSIKNSAYISHNT